MRQFRSDDTSAWGIRYGSLSKGAKSFGNETIGSASGANYSSLSGSSGASTATTSGLSNGTYNLPCVIIVMQGTIPSPDSWEFNFITTVSSGTATFLYPLQHTYGSGNVAQIITANDYLNITLSGTLSCPGWNGSTGGIGFLMGGNSIIGSGSLNTVGLGFRAGSTAGNNTGQQGEGTAGTGIQVTSPNGNGGGGGGSATDSGHVEAGNSGGGGNLSAGGGGSNRNTSTGGSGGNAVSSQDGRVLALGGGSGQAGGDWNAGPGLVGIAGSGVWITVARQQAWTGGVSIQGQNGTSSSTKAATGGSAAGCWIAKGQRINIAGSINIAGGTGGTCTANFGGVGGNGSTGVGHIDYSATTTAGVDSRQDPIYSDGGAFFIFF